MYDIFNNSLVIIIIIMIKSHWIIFFKEIYESVSAFYFQHWTGMSSASILVHFYGESLLIVAISNWLWPQGERVGWYRELILTNTYLGRLFAFSLSLQGF